MKVTVTSRLPWFLAMVAWMALIFYLSDQPKGNIPAFGAWDLLLKKGAHALAYAILAWLSYRVTGRNRWAFLVVLVYATSDELHQRLVPGRNGQLLDVLIDCLGGLFWLVAGHYRRRAQSVQTSSAGERLPRDA